MIIHRKIIARKMARLWRCLLAAAAALCSFCLSVPAPALHQLGPRQLDPHLEGPHPLDPHLESPHQLDPHLGSPYQLDATSFAQSSASGNKLSLDLKVQQSGLPSSVVEKINNNNQLDPSVMDEFWTEWIKYLQIYLTSNDCFEGRAKSVEKSFHSLLEELLRLTTGHPRGVAADKENMNGVEGRKHGHLAHFYHMLKSYLGKPPGIIALANYDPIKIALTIAAVWGINVLFWVSYLPKIERQEPIADNFLNNGFDEEMAGQLVGQGLRQDAGQSLGQDADEGFGKDAGQGLGQDAGQSLGQDTGQSLGQDTGQGFGPDTGQSLGQDEDGRFGQDTGQRLGQNAGQDADEGFSQYAGQDASQSFVQNADTAFNRYVVQGFDQYPDQGSVHYPHTAFSQATNGNFHQTFDKRNQAPSEDSVEGFNLDSPLALGGSLRQQHLEWPHLYTYKYPQTFIQR